MCDPVTATTLAVLAGGTQMYSQIEQGKQTRAVANYNARELENQATRTRNKGVEEENIQRQRTAELRAQQLARIGAAGVDAETGSAADLLQDTDILGEVDALRIRQNFQDEANQIDRQAELTLQQGKNAERTRYISAIGTALSTAATVGSLNAPVPAAGSTEALGAAGVSGTPVNPKWYTNSSSFFGG